MTELQRVIESIKNLPVNDRAEMARLLLVSLDERPDSPQGSRQPLSSSEPQWFEKVEQRLSELQQGAAETVNWEELKGKLLQNNE